MGAASNPLVPYAPGDDWDWDRFSTPGEFRAALGIAPGHTLILLMDPDGLRVLTPAQAVARAQALVQGETGADRVAACIPGARISAVNLAEVVGKLADAGMPRDAIDLALSGLGLRVATFDEGSAYDVGVLRPATRAHVQRKPRRMGGTRPWWGSFVR